MAARGVSTILRLECFIDCIHNQVHRAQHVGQHMVGLDLQVIGFQLNWHVAVTQVVGRANQVIRGTVFGAMRDAQHGLWRSHHLDQRAVFGDQNIATARHRAAWQKDTQLATG